MYTGGILLAHLLVAISALVLFFRIPNESYRLLAILLFGLGWFFFSTTMLYGILNRYVINGFFLVIPIVSFVLLAGLIIYMLWAISPRSATFLDTVPIEDLEQYIQDDIKTYQYLDSLLSSTVENIKHSGFVHKDFTELSTEEVSEIKGLWSDFVQTLFELDFLKRRYEGFSVIDPKSNPSLHAKSFLLAYGSFLSQYTNTLELSKIIRSPEQKTFLNQGFEELGIPKDFFTWNKYLLTHPGEIVRLNLGRLYLKKIQPNASEFNISPKLEKIDNSIFSDYPSLIFQNPLSALKKKGFSYWFPIQKTTTLQLSYIRTTTRDYLITPEIVQKQIKDKLEPGDILLERREWHATNIGIPGFWTHAAFYIGDANTIDSYYADVSQLETGQKPIDHLRTLYPEAVKKLEATDSGNFSQNVIEAKRPGVIIISLEESTNADSLAVLRIKDISKEEKFNALKNALSHYGKPYDYNFTFVTEDALVCSELIYRAFQDSNKITITPKNLNSRLIFTPNNFAEKFSKEFETDSEELELVLFLDGNEKERTVTPKGVTEFIESYTRPKWHIWGDFINKEYLSKTKTFSSWIYGKIPEITKLSPLDAKMANLILKIKKESIKKSMTHVPLEKIEILHPLNRTTSIKKLQERITALKEAIDLQEDIEMSNEQLNKIIPSITPIQVITKKDTYYTFEGNGRVQALKESGIDGKIEVELFELPQESKLPQLALSIKKSHKI